MEKGRMPRKSRLIVVQNHPESTVSNGPPEGGLAHGQYYKNVDQTRKLSSRNYSVAEMRCRPFTCSRIPRGTSRIRGERLGVGVVRAPGGLLIVVDHLHGNQLELASVDELGR